MMINTDALQVPTVSSARVLMPVLWQQGLSASSSLSSQSDNAKLASLVTRERDLVLSSEATTPENFSTVFCFLLR
jgi:hypothetical protein